MDTCYRASLVSCNEAYGDFCCVLRSFGMAYLHSYRVVELADSQFDALHPEAYTFGLEPFQAAFLSAGRNDEPGTHKPAAYTSESTRAERQGNGIIPRV